MATIEVETLDKLQRTDHDTLIRLESKVDSLIDDMKEVKDGTALKIANHEIRINDLEKKVRDFLLTWKFILAVSSIAGAIASLIIKLVGSYFGFLK